MKGLIIEQRDEIILQVLAMVGIDTDTLTPPKAPFTKAFGFFEFANHHVMLEIDANHPDPADNGYSLFMLPTADNTAAEAKEFFNAFNQIDAALYVTSHPLCAA